MIKIYKNNKSVEIYELQGEAENIEDFNGVFDKEKIFLDFSTYILKGKLVDKKVSVLVKDDDGTMTIIEDVKYYTFDKPPRYKL
jgi:uncharacterized lipoprotein